MFSKAVTECCGRVSFDNVQFFGSISGSVVHVHAQQGCDDDIDESERRKQLRTKLEQVQEKIDQQEQNLNQKRQERQSLERVVKILEGEIEEAQLNIRQKHMRINNLEEEEIAQKEDRIDNLGGRINRLKESLSELVRRRARVSHMSLVPVAFSNQSVSEFFQ